MKYLCFDLGLSHTGVAVSHEGQLVELLPTLSTRTKEELLTKVKNQIKVNEPNLTVLGQPGRGPIAELSNWLFEELKKHDYSVDLAEEDLSSKVAQKHLYESHLPVKKRHMKEHSGAAAVILQAYLDTL
jgi:RNase H-fold protein (predicted Holliday junction resolvase)